MQGSVRHSKEVGYCSKSHGKALQDFRGVTWPNVFQWHKEDSDHGHESPQTFVSDQDHRQPHTGCLWVCTSRRETGDEARLWRTAGVRSSGSG